MGSSHFDGVVDVACGGPDALQIYPLGGVDEGPWVVGAGSGQVGDVGQGGQLVPEAGDRLGRLVAQSGRHDERVRVVQQGQQAGARGVERQAGAVGLMQPLGIARQVAAGGA